MEKATFIAFTTDKTASGLFVAESYPVGSWVCRSFLVLLNSARASSERWQCSKAKVMAVVKPDLDNLAVLINTAGPSERNNVEFRFDKTRQCINVYAKCPLKPGDQLLAAYGSGYTRQIRRGGQTDRQTT